MLPLSHSSPRKGMAMPEFVFTSLTLRARGAPRAAWELMNRQRLAGTGAHGQPCSREEYESRPGWHGFT